MHPIGKSHALYLRRSHQSTQSRQRWRCGYRQRASRWISNMSRSMGCICALGAPSTCVCGWFLNPSYKTHHMLPSMLLCNQQLLRVGQLSICKLIVNNQSCSLRDECRFLCSIGSVETAPTRHKQIQTTAKHDPKSGGGLVIPGNTISLALFYPCVRVY
jgi:hypothetical protein